MQYSVEDLGVVKEKLFNRGALFFFFLFWERCEY